MSSVVICSVVGAAFAALPFIGSLTPSMSAATSASKVVSIDELLPGDIKIVSWMNTPIIFYKASESEIHSYQGVSTYRGCALKYLPRDEEEYGPKWEGGWIDPCHIGAWDMQGKFLAGANSDLNTVLPDLADIEGLSWEGTNAVLRVRDGGN